MSSFTSKLVRDNIPKIISDSQLDRFRFVTLSDEEYAKQLKKKLLEEVEEYLQEENMEELADIYEVLDAIVQFKKFDPNEILKVKQKKLNERGGFEKRLLMEVVS